MLGFNALSSAPLSSFSTPAATAVFSETDIILWPVENTADIYLRDPALTEVDATSGGAGTGVRPRSRGWMPRKPPRVEVVEPKKRKRIQIPDDIGVDVEIWLDDEPVIALPVIAAPVESAPEPLETAPAVAPPVTATPTLRTRERIIFEPRPRRPKPGRLRLERLRRQADEERILIALASLV